MRTLLTIAQLKEWEQYILTQIELLKDRDDDMSNAILFAYNDTLTQIRKLITYKEKEI